MFIVVYLKEVQLHIRLYRFSAILIGVLSHYVFIVSLPVITQVLPYFYDRVDKLPSANENMMVAALFGNIHYTINALAFIPGIFTLFVCLGLAGLVTKHWLELSVQFERWVYMIYWNKKTF